MREPSEPCEPLLGNLYLGTFSWEPLLGNLYLGIFNWEPLLGNLGTFTWEPGNLYLGTFTWNLGTLGEWVLELLPPVCSETFTMAEDPKAFCCWGNTHKFRQQGGSTGGGEGCLGIARYASSHYSHHNQQLIPHPTYFIVMVITE